MNRSAEALAGAALGDPHLFAAGQREQRAAVGRDRERGARDAAIRDGAPNDPPAAAIATSSEPSGSNPVAPRDARDVQAAIVSPPAETPICTSAAGAASAWQA